MAVEQSGALTNIQQLIDVPADPAQVPPFVRGMDLSGVVFKSVEVGRFELEWTVHPHLTHSDGIVQRGVVNVVADTGQSFAFYSTSIEQEAYSTYEFTTRFVRPIRADDRIAVVSEVVNRSRRIATIEARMVNKANEKLCAMMTGAWLLASRDLG